MLDDPVHSLRAPLPRRPEYDDTEAFLRIGLRDFIAQRVASEPGTVVVYLLDDALERLACSPDRRYEDEDGILAAVLEETAMLPPSARTARDPHDQ